MGLELKPDGDNGGANARVSLWGKNSEVHLWSGEKDSPNDEGHPLNTNSALWLNAKAGHGSARLVAREAISALLGKSPHEILQEKDQGFGVDKNNLVLSHTKFVRISGNGNFMTDYVGVKGDKVGFYGVYAKENNQENIYARFA